MLVLEGKGPNHDAIGATVRVRAGGLLQTDSVTLGGGFGSTNSHALEQGLGSYERADRVEVRWPGAGGGASIYTDLAADHAYRLRAGREEAEPIPWEPLETAW